MNRNVPTRAGAPTVRTLARLLLGVLALLPSVTSAEARLVATRITADGFADHHVGGPDADAGVGDWFLSNGTLCAAISDPGHESPLTPNGGALIDLGHCGANDDQWDVLQPMLNLSQSQVVPIREIEAGVETDRAWIRTRALFLGVEIATTYSVDRSDPKVLRVVTEAERVTSGDALFSIGQLLLHAGGQTPVFSLDLGDPDASVGFAHPASDRRSPASLLSALVASDLTVLVGAAGMPPISYGLERVRAVLRSPTADPEAAIDAPIGTFSVSGEHFTFMAALTRPPWIGEASGAPSLLQLAQLPWMDVQPGERVLLEQRIHVGDRADVASITDRVFEGTVPVTGRVDDPSTRIHVDRVSGAALTEVRPDEEGRFGLRLAPGTYRLRAVAPGNRSVEQTLVVEPNGGSDPVSLSMGPPTRIVLPQNFVGRIVFLSEVDGQPVFFGDHGLGHRIGERRVPGALHAPWLPLGGGPEDPESVTLPPGGYRVLASRGPEYELVEVALRAEAGETRRLSLPPLRRVAATPGWIAADLHVHSGASFDSGLPQTRQIAAFVASGAEVLVATEHDRVFDPRPAIARAGLQHELVSITGVEATSTFEGGDAPFSTGHLNAFPLEQIETAHRGGAPRMEGRRLRDVLADLRAKPNAPFVQLNHPRPHEGEAGDDAYFSHLSVAGDPFDPTLPLSTMPNSVLIEASPEHGGTDLDFHGLELMNGPDLLRYRRLRADWLSLLLQGERLVATANSDSHRLGELVGLPRTYVAQRNDSLPAFEPTAFLAALREGRAWGTSGPLVEARLGEAGLGELHRGADGLLQIHVEAPAWVPIREWRAYVNGELVHRAPIKAGETATLPLAFAADAFVTVEVEGRAEGLYRNVLPGFVPLAFTNPIYVDVDGNGRFDAPGLRSPLPSTIRRPDRHD